VLTLVTILAITLTVIATRNSNKTGFVVAMESGDFDSATWWGGDDKANIRESLGIGACWIDFDNDDDPDLFVPNASRRYIEKSEAGTLAANHDLEDWRFYINRNGRFAPAPVLPLIKDWGVGCTVGDVNGDGYDDLLVTTALQNDRLLMNQNGERFIEATKFWQAPPGQLSASAAFGDLDNDGDLDLIITRYLEEPEFASTRDCRWKGKAVMCGPRGLPMLSDLLFENQQSVLRRLDTIDGFSGYGLGVVIFDPDLDGDMDFFIANDSNENRLFVNRGAWRFDEQGFISGVGFSHQGMTQAGMGVDAGDIDGDGREDLIVTNFAGDYNNLFHNDQTANTFSDWAGRSGIAEASYPYLGWSTLLEDFDLDGDLDIFVVNGHVYPEADDIHEENPLVPGYKQRLQLLMNDGSGNFSPVDQLFVRDEDLLMSGRGAAVADYDDDGDMDIVVIREGQTPLLLKNNYSNLNHRWLKVRLQGKPGNHRGLGARVEVCAVGECGVRTVRTGRGYLSASDSTLIFGLGTADRVDRLSVYWPDGSTTYETNIPANSSIRIRQVQ
jgi:hypothetical protein